MKSTHECHQFAHGTLNMQDISALNTDNTALDTERWEQNVGAVILDDLAHFVETLQQNGIELGVSHHHWLHKHLCGHDKVM